MYDSFIEQLAGLDLSGFSIKPAPFDQTDFPCDDAIDQTLTGGFGGAVRAHGTNGIILANKGGARITKHRTSGREHKLGHAGPADRRKEPGGGAHVVLPGWDGLTHRSADMHIRRKMLHAIKRFVSQQGQDGLLISGIKHVEGHAQMLGGVGATGPEIIQPMHFVPLLLESRYGVRPDVARGPCDQNSHTGVSARR